MRSPHSTVVIRTIVPIATWTDLRYALLPNGHEHNSLEAPPGGLKLSYVNGLYASGIRRNADRPYPNYPEYFMGWHAYLNGQEPTSVDRVFTSISDGLAGYRSIWWQRQLPQIPVFIAQGFTDDLFPIGEATRMLDALRTIDPAYPIAAYFGDIGHPRAANKPGEIDYVLGLIRAWLAYYMKGVGTPPPNIVYAALTRPRDEAFDPANVATAPTLAALATTTVSQSFDQPALLVNPLTDPASGFFWDPLVLEGARELPVPPESPTVDGSLATYDMPVTQQLVIAGRPTVSFHASVVGVRVQLDVRLFDVDASGRKQLVTRGTTTLQSADILAPIGEMDVTIRTYGNFWRVESGHTLRLELTNVDSPYITPSRVPSQTTVSAVRLDIPVR